MLVIGLVILAVAVIAIVAGGMMHKSPDSCGRGRRREGKPFSVWPERVLADEVLPAILDIATYISGMQRRLAFMMVATFVIVGCGSKNGSSPQQPLASSLGGTNPPATTGASSGTGHQRYAGLGAAKSTFEASNAQAPPNPAGAPAGLAWYTVVATDSSGRVIAFEMQENAKPSMGNRERMALTSGTLLPDDATETSLNSNTCIVWKSAELKRLTGLEYAAATTATGTTTARMRAKRSPSCSEDG
jgi:hypothetical protein